MDKATKRLAGVVILFLIAASCHNAIDRQLDEIEWKLSDNPRSAYEQLSEIPADDLNSKSRQARYALLMSLAMDKSYIDVADDSLIQVAVRYYKNRGADRNRMLALYSLGRVQLNAENRTSAIISLLQAKEIAERLDDRHYLGLITKNMAYIYGDSQDYDTELSCYQESVSSFLSIEEWNYVAYSELGEARSLLSKGEFDAADSVFRHLEEYAHKEQDYYLLASVLKDRASIMMEPGRISPGEAIKLYREAGELGFPADMTADLGTLAIAFEFLNQTDSALYYLALAENNANTLLDSIHFYNTKFRILNHGGHQEEANSQMLRGINLHNKLIFNRNNQQIANTVSVYSQQEALRQAEVARYRLILLFLSIVALLAMIGFLYLNIRSRKRQLQMKALVIQEKEQKIEEEMAQIQEISEELQWTRENQSEMAQTINSLIRAKIEIVKICADAYETVKNEPKQNPKDPYRYLDEDPVKKKEKEMQQFLQALDMFRKDDTIFALLEENVNKWRENLMVKLRKACAKESMSKPQFTENDFRLIMLFYSGIPDRTIAFLLDMTCSAVRTRKTRYKDRLIQPDIPDGYFFVQELTSFNRR